MRVKFSSQAIFAKFKPELLIITACIIFSDKSWLNGDELANALKDITRDSANFCVLPEW